MLINRIDSKIEILKRMIQNFSQEIEELKKEQENNPNIDNRPAIQYCLGNIEARKFDIEMLEELRSEVIYESQWLFKNIRSAFGEEQQKMEG